MSQKHPIKVVSNRTGLTTHVIRVWERRYNAVSPSRTESNRRLYSDEDIYRLDLLRRATEAGETISQIAGLSNKDLEKLVHDNESFQRPNGHRDTALDETTAEKLLSECIEAVRDMDPEGLRSKLLQASVAVSRPVLLINILEPLMRKVGDLWREGTIKVVHEHMASAIVRTFLGSLIMSYRTVDTAPKLVATTPAGQLHEFGSLMSVVAAISDGWQATYLGPNLPAEEIADAVKKNYPAVLSLSIIYPENDPQLVAELRKLREFLGDEVAILIGGRAADGYKNTIDEIGAIYLDNLGEFRNKLDEIRISKKM